MTPFVISLAGLAANVTQLVVPRNINRYSLIVSYQSVTPNIGQVGYSFGPPLFTNNTTAGLAGIFFNPANSMAQQYTSETVPIDDVWVIIQAANGGNMVFYEGTIALDANV